MLRFNSFLVVLAVVASVLGIRCCFPKWLAQRRLSIHGWSDPKTVSAKSQSMDSSSTGSHDPRIDTLRFAAFGSSKTWGSGLEDPDTQSYIKLLSPNGANFGLRATGAGHPSLCVQTMVGDRDFDVIILEFAPTDFEDFERLVKRVRSRFPSAIIIFLTVFAPLFQFSYRGEVAVTHLLRLNINYNKVPVAKVIQHLNASEFSFPTEQLHQESMATCTKIVQSVGGYVLEFPPLHNHIKRYILENAKYFGNAMNKLDFTHPSVLGHQTIADLIRSIISDVALSNNNQTQEIDDINSGGTTTTTTTSRHSSTVSSQQLVVVASDRCTSYYKNGDVSSLHHVMRDIKGLKLVNMMETFVGDKWALEVDRTGAEFTLVCAFPNCQVYLSHMIKGPEKEYPRVLISIFAGQDPILVDPITSIHHLQRTTFLGTVKEPGEIAVRVTPVPEDESSPLLFRITSIITYQEET